MYILAFILVGLIAGALAKLIMPGRDPGGIFITMLLGMIGAVVAGFLGHTLGWYKVDEGPGIIGAVFGAVITLAIYRLSMRRPTTRP